MSSNHRVSDSVGLWKDLRIIVSNKIPGDALAGNHCYVPFLLPVLGYRALALSVLEWKGMCGGGGGKEREMFLLSWLWLQSCLGWLLLSNSTTGCYVFWLCGRYSNAGSFGVSHMWVGSLRGPKECVSPLNNFLMHSILLLFVSYLHLCPHHWWVSPLSCCCVLY